MWTVQIPDYHNLLAERNAMVQKQTANVNVAKWKWPNMSLLHLITFILVLNILDYEKVLSFAKDWLLTKIMAWQMKF